MYRYLISLIALCLWLPIYGQSPLPITSYDYAIPENNVSAIAIGMGGMNVTNPQDPFASYSNPALLANGENTLISTSFRLTNNDDLTFAEATRISNFLRDKQFKYFTVVAKQAAFSYQPVASINISEFVPSTNRSRYYDYKLDKAQFSMGFTDSNWANLAAGLNLKYLSGRLVYLAERREGNDFIREAFIDDKVKGFSSDLGFTYKNEAITYGLVAYDFVSRLWWENYSSKSIQRRIATGIQYGSGNSKTSFGLQSKLSNDPETTYHFGYSNGLAWDSKDFTTDEATTQGADMRIGLYSHDFQGVENMNLTLGGGYYYQLFRFDFSLNSKGLKLADSEYLFALGIGF